MVAQCHALESTDSLWSFCPSLPASDAFFVLFGITTIIHIVQAIQYRKAYCWVVAMAGAWQTVGYVFRTISIRNPTSVGDYALWFIFILCAPLWTNAFVYMVFGRMVWNFNTKAKIYGITAWRFGLYFVILDVIAFIIQIFGAASITGKNPPVSQVLRGLHIYMIGVGIQQFFVLVFLTFAISFHRKLLIENPHQKSRALQMLYILYTVVALITMRIIFRLCEYANGLKSTIPLHEAYQYALDSLPMLIALVLLNIVHPGRIMPGREGDIPGRSERKHMKVNAKADIDVYDTQLPIQQSVQYDYGNNRPAEAPQSLQYGETRPYNPPAPYQPYLGAGAPAHSPTQYQPYANGGV